MEVDSWIPHEIAPFLSKGHEPREYNGVKGERLKTIKLRGVLSQGLILPLSIFDGTILEEVYFFESPSDGDDLTELLGIQKWEKSIPAQLSGKAKGNFPSHTPKTDAERCQNLKKKIFEEHYDEMYEVTIKLDGSSMTVYHNDGVTVVCSRNWDLQLDQEGNSFVYTATSTGLLEALKKLNMNISVQGELIGPNIQGNREGLSKLEFHVFNIYDIDACRYMTATERYIIFDRLCNLGADIKHAPVLFDHLNLKESFIENTKSLLKLAEGKSLNNPIREGLVFKSLDSDFNFNVINNQYLLQVEE